MSISKLIADTIPVLYEDNHLLVVDKPAGMLTQADKTGDRDLLSHCKLYLKNRYNKPGNVYLGLVHRLDRPVSGVVVLARTSKAAGRLSEQIRQHKVEKRYTAMVSGSCPDQGRWHDRLARKGSHGYIDRRGKEAELSFTRIGYEKGISTVQVELVTGRHHQIRIQFASRGFPVVGDMRYGSRERFYSPRAIALHSTRYSCLHPTKGEHLVFTSEPDGVWQRWLADPVVSSG